MKVKLLNTDHAAGMIDPHTKRSPFLDLADPANPKVVEVADVPENSFWVRRVIDGELARVEDAPAPAKAAPVKAASKEG